MESLDRIVINSIPALVRGSHGYPSAYLGVPIVHFDLSFAEAETIFAEGSFDELASDSEITTFGASFETNSPPRTFFVKPSITYQPSQVVIRPYIFRNGAYVEFPSEGYRFDWMMEGTFSITLFFRGGKPSETAEFVYTIQGTNGGYEPVEQLINGFYSIGVGVYDITYDEGEDKFWKDKSVVTGAHLKSQGKKLFRPVLSSVIPKPTPIPWSPPVTFTAPTLAHQYMASTTSSPKPSKQSKPQGVPTAPPIHTWRCEKARDSDGRIVLVCYKA